MLTSYHLITVVRKYKLDLVLETKERKDDICNNLELPQEISKPMQLNRHNARKNAHGVMNDTQLQ